MTYNILEQLPDICRSPNSSVCLSLGTTPAGSRFLPTVNRVPLRTAFLYHLPVVLICC